MYGRFSKEINVMAAERGWPEDFRNAAMERASAVDAQNLAYGLYMAECEGYLNTKESKVNAMLKDIVNKHNRGITYMELDQDYVSQFGLDIEDLTQNDINRCERALLSGRR